MQHIRAGLWSSGRSIPGRWYCNFIFTESDLVNYWKIRSGGDRKQQIEQRRKRVEKVLAWGEAVTQVLLWGEFGSYCTGTGIAGDNTRNECVLYILSWVIQAANIGSAFSFHSFFLLFQFWYVYFFFLFIIHREWPTIYAIYSQFMLLVLISKSALIDSQCILV